MASATKSGRVSAIRTWRTIRTKSDFGPDSPRHSFKRLIFTLTITVSRLGLSNSHGPN
jgi:hypothetical protein